MPNIFESLGLRAKPAAYGSPEALAENFVAAQDIAKRVQEGRNAGKYYGRAALAHLVPRETEDGEIVNRLEPVKLRPEDRDEFVASTMIFAQEAIDKAGMPYGVYDADVYRRRDGVDTVEVYVIDGSKKDAAQYTSARQ